MSAPALSSSGRASLGADGAATLGVDAEGVPVTIHRLLGLDADRIAQLERRLGVIMQAAPVHSLGVRRAALDRGVIVVERPPQTLADACRAGPLPEHRATAILRDVAVCLQAALRAGLVHGHLTPASVGLFADGSVRVDLLGLRTASVNPLARACGRADLQSLPLPTPDDDVYALGVLLLAARVGETAALDHLARSQTAATTAGADHGRGPLEELNLEMLVREAAWRPGLSEVVQRLVALAPRDGEQEARTAVDHGRGEVLGHFELGEVLGEGAMGRVYRARDRINGQEVALKVIARDDAPTPRALRRFKKEARILGELRNPGIASLIEAGEDGGRLYMAVELVEGRPLGRVVRERGPFPEQEALEVIADVARALIDVHGAGIVHRDIKPDNILLVGPDGADAAGGRPGGSRIKLIDFGIARHFDETTSLAMTRQGAVVGTPLYMPPEQAQGLPVDSRSDIYALGTTLYELLCGAAPFAGQGAAAVVAAQIESPVPSVREKRGDVRDETARLVARCLDKDPAARPQNARELLTGLEAILHASPASIAAHPQEPSTDGILRYVFEWHLRAPPARLWPYVINTDRLNHAIGLGAVDESYQAINGQLARMGHSKQLGFDLKWHEHPFEWVFERRLGVLREYSEGPLRWLKSSVDLIPDDAGGTRLVHAVTLEPRGMIGRAAAAVEIGIKTKRALERVYTRIDRLVQDGAPAAGADPFDESQALSPERQQRLEQLERAVVAAGAAGDVVARLGEFIRAAPAMEVARMRPLALAERFGVAEDAMIRTCLLAAREGMLVPLWDLLCPSCRAPAGIEETLRALHEHAHCEVCNIEFALDLSTTIELVFRAHPQLRTADTATYCLGSPVKTPHVVAQVRLAAGERFAFEMRLEAGGYLLVGKQADLMLPFSVAHSAPASRFEVSLARTKQPPPALGLSLQEIVVVNDTGREQLVRVERTALRTDVLTAARAASHPLFRQLFPEELVRAGSMVRVSNVTFLVAEVAGAVPSRAEEGDASAFSVLYASFKALEERVVAAGGSPVKLHGEGFLAVFDRPDAAVTAALSFRAALLAAAPGLSARVGLHRGAAAAVTLNERLDYFGKNVLLAIELMRSAGDDEVVMSDAFLADAGVRHVVEGALGAQALTSVSLEGTPRFRLTAPQAP